MLGRRVGQEPTSRLEVSVSPYLERPCRSLEEVLRDLTERAERGSGVGSPADTASEPAYDAPEDRRQA